MSTFKFHGDVPAMPYGDVGILIRSSITVCKIPLLQSSTRQRPITESQRALSCFLEKKRTLYHSRQRVLHSCPVTRFSNDSYANESANTTMNSESANTTMNSESANTTVNSESASTTANFADNELSFEEIGMAPEKEKKKGFKSFKAHDRRRKKTVKPSKGDVLGRSKPSQVSKPKPSSFIEVDSKELAERVVNHAKERMRAKHEQSMSGAYSRPIRTSTPIPINQRKICPKMCRTETNTPASQLSADLNDGTTDSPINSKIRRHNPSKEAQQASSTSSALELSSSSPQGCKRVTNAVIHPPNYYLKFTLKMRAAEHQAKLLQEARSREMKVKLEEERKAQRITIMKQKAQQRAEIYALNEVMAKFEKEQFEAATSAKV